MIDAIYALCREGLPIERIARKVKATHQSVRLAIINDHQPWLDQIVPVELRNLQSARCPPSIIADLFEVTEWQLHAFIMALPELSEYSVNASEQQHVTPLAFLERIPGSTGVIKKIANREKMEKCSRCEILEDPGNPVEGELCLWCPVEGKGWSVLDWHEAGCPDLFND